MNTPIPEIDEELRKEITKTDLEQLMKAYRATERAQLNIVRAIEKTAAMDRHILAIIRGEVTACLEEAMEHMLSNAEVARESGEKRS